METEEEEEFQREMAEEHNTPQTLEWAMNQSKKPCPECGMPYDKLEWSFYCSPKASWRALAGRAGFVASCPKCRINVSYVTVMMN
ncbi:MAG: hypothetical protein II852_05275 [Bacteroidales bacterium]|nr:hypothetical protein [Bacteroidales bacterium]